MYLFIGPPGSGKGTLSNFLVKRFAWQQLSTGNLLRRHIAEQTDIGKQIDFAIKSGKLVADSLVNAMVEKWLAETLSEADDIILDGYPRTIAQAESFDRFLGQLHVKVDVIVVSFFISDKEVIDRISRRLVCQNKECQKVYSALDDSSLKPRVSMTCDVCGSPLGKRSDDTAASVHERLESYHKHEQELLHFYKTHNYHIYQVNVEKPFDKVFAEFASLLGISTV